MNTFKMVSAAALIAALPMMASAAHITYGGTLGTDPNDRDGTNAIDVLAGPHSFQAAFTADDGDNIGGNFTFQLFNSSSSAAAVTLAITTINQGSTYGFDGGVMTTLGAAVQNTAQNVNDSFTLSTSIGAGDTQFLTFAYGDAFGTLNQAGAFIGPDIDFRLEASAVPVPAAGLLLLGALGGIGAMRRRKKA